MNNLQITDDLHQAFLSAVQQLPTKHKTIYIALSGGADSVALLLTANQFVFQYPNYQIKAIHINHNVQNKSDDWAQFCQTLCQQMNIPLEVVKLDWTATLAPLHHSEAELRIARIKALCAATPSSAAIFCAHHQNDQTETILFRLLRGTGLLGLRGMIPIKAMHARYFVRPFLSISKLQLQAYLKCHQQTYIEDDSNLDCHYDRNFLRHYILPKLKERFKSVDDNLQRFSKLATEQEAVVDYLLEDWFMQSFCKQHLSLDCTQLKRAPLHVQTTMIRHWLKHLNTLGLNVNMPSKQQCDRIIQEVVMAKQDAQPKFKLATFWIRRFQNNLFLLQHELQQDYSALQYTWDGCAQLALPSGHVLPGDLKLPVGKYTVRYRRLNDKSSLKKRFQALGIPPWLRNSTPLVFEAKDLITIIK